MVFAGDAKIFARSGIADLASGPKTRKHWTAPPGRMEFFQGG